MEDQKLTRQDVAELFQLPIRTLDYLVGTGQIPFSRIGKRNVRFDRGRLEAWFKEREGKEYRLQRKE
jgi:excisionase family DNA binding protein